MQAPKPQFDSSVDYWCTNVIAHYNRTLHKQHHSFTDQTIQHHSFHHHYTTLEVIKTEDLKQYGL